MLRALKKPIEEILKTILEKYKLNYLFALENFRPCLIACFLFSIYYIQHQINKFIWNISSFIIRNKPWISLIQGRRHKVKSKMECINIRCYLNKFIYASFVVQNHTYTLQFLLMSYRHY